MATSDIINVILLLITATTGFAAFRQIYISNRQKRADLLLQLYAQFYQDKDMQDIYYQIEYGVFIYSVGTFHMSDNERKLDKLLSLFSNIGQLYQMGIIKSKDLQFIKYEFQIIFEDNSVQQYFATLDNWFETRQINHLKFQAFREVGQLITIEEL